jgi:RNA polymerase sigma-70 factor (ECF subfamily)
MSVTDHSAALNEIPTSDHSTTRLSLLLRMRDVADDGAWDEFVAMYAPRIFCWCRKFGLQEADAADATQMVLLKLVDHLARFEYDAKQGRFRSWLKTITRHVAVDVHRKWVQRTDGEPEVLIGNVLDDEPSPADELYQAIETAWKEDVLRQAEARVQLLVQPETWQAYWLCCREQLPAQAVAEKLGLSVSMVYVGKSRVLKSLRAEVQRLDPDGD